MVKQETETSSLSDLSMRMGIEKDPKGGLTKEGIEAYNKKHGANLQVGVTWKPKTKQDFLRKGKFLLRFYNRQDLPPLVKEDGTPTRYSLAATKWGEKAPTTVAQVRKLASKGKDLLATYKRMKEEQKMSNQVSTIEQLPLKLSNGLVKIPIAKKGSWYHEAHGKVEFDSEDFEQIKSLSNIDVLGFTPYITYGHPTDLPYASVDAELKKGDLVSWLEEDDVLFGLFDAKEDVVSFIKNGDYEYSSGEFLRNYKDKNTGDNKGTLLMRVALTNSPFIPFGDAKLEALSQARGTDSPITTSYSLKLFLEDNVTTTVEEASPNVITSIEETPPSTPYTESLTVSQELSLPIDSNEVNISTEDLSTTVTVPNVAKTLEDIIMINNADKKEEVKVDAVEAKLSEACYEQEWTPEEEKAEEEKEAALDASKVDLSLLVASITEAVVKANGNQIEAMSAKYDAIVDGLRTELSQVTNKLSSTEEVTQAFSSSLANQKALKEHQELAGKGVPAVLIQKFSQITTALSSKETVIKLSSSVNGAVVEQDVQVAEAIKELLVTAVNTAPVTLERFGQSYTPSYASSNPLQVAIQELTNSNRAIANKKSV